MADVRAHARALMRHLDLAGVGVDEDLLASWFSEVFPPSSDMVEFAILGDKVVAHCLICQEDLGDVSYLNEALVLWSKHRGSTLHVQTDVEIVHLKHFYDGYPLCWPNDKDGPFKGSARAEDVTCEHCQRIIQEDS